MDQFSPLAPRHRLRTKVLIGVSAVLVALLVVGAILVNRYWPYTEVAVRDDLASATSANVRFGNFHKKFFPPGCVAEAVIFQRNSFGVPLITIRRLTISSNFAGLVRRHVNLIRAEGMHVTLSRSAFTVSNSSSKQRTIDALVASDAILEVPRRSPQRSTRLEFHSFSLKNLGGSGLTHFSAWFDNPMPHGEIRTAGVFGPWNSSRPEQTSVAGKYSLEHADLGVFDGIGGILSSVGDFTGTFKQVNVQGSSNTPEFEVKKTKHTLPLRTRFHAIVDATNGDVIVPQVNATFGKSDIEAQSNIAHRADGKRTAIIDLHSEHGRIEDAFYPFIHSPKSPLAGEVSFVMHVTIPSGHDRFLKKINLQSNFTIHGARFTHAGTQTEISKLGESPGQKEPDTSALSDFSGQVQISHGITQFTDLSVHDQSASAMFRGSYDLVDEKVDLHGKLKTATSLAKTTHGIKAMFAKAVEPFFKNKPHETVVPVRIGGTYTHPSFGLDVNSNM